MKNPFRQIVRFSVCLLLLTSLTLAKPVAFQEAQRTGDDIPGGSLSWTFTWKGKSGTVDSSGKGSVDGKFFQVPLNSTRLTARLYTIDYGNDLLLLVEETDEESGAGKLVRFVTNKKKLEPKWTVGIPALNVGPGLLDGDSAYLSARATAMRVDLKTGHWDWRKNNLNRLRADTVYRFNAFGVPQLQGANVVYPELSTDGSITLSKASGEVVEIK